MFLRSRKQTTSVVWLLLPVALLCCFICTTTASFVLPTITSTVVSFAPLSAEPKRIARRDLKKKSNRRTRQGKSRTTTEKQDLWEASETRPLVREKSVEAGEDYWMDEQDWKNTLERDAAVKNRKAMEGETPQEKLRAEVVAPYKQNWIGLLSVIMVIFATIVTKFPELLQSPLIPIPDL